jgi:hypothetical protein
MSATSVLGGFSSLLGSPDIQTRFTVPTLTLVVPQGHTELNGTHSSMVNSFLEPSGFLCLYSYSTAM